MVYFNFRKAMSTKFEMHMAYEKVPLIWNSATLRLLLLVSEKKGKKSLILVFINLYVNLQGIKWQHLMTEFLITSFVL